MSPRYTRSKIVYKRKISSTEAEARRLIILKDQLSKFPPPKTDINVCFNNFHSSTMVTSVPCECRGLHHPHVHFYLDLSEIWDVANLKKGVTVHLVREEKTFFRLQIDMSYS